MSLQILPLNPKNLEALIKQARHYNIPPIFLPQYIPEVQQKYHPLTSLLVKLIDEACECLSVCQLSEIENGSTEPVLQKC